MIDRMAARLFVRGGPGVCSKWAREWAGRWAVVGPVMVRGGPGACSKWAREWAGRWVVVGPVMVRGGPGGGAWLVGRGRSQVQGHVPLFVCSFGRCLSGVGTFAFCCV